MPKGKTNQPLRITCSDDLRDLPEIQKLIEQGHTVDFWQAEGQPHLILGPHCWRMHGSLAKYLKLALTSARGFVYNKGKVSKPKEDESE